MASPRRRGRLPSKPASNHALRLTLQTTLALLLASCNLPAGAPATSAPSLESQATAQALMTNVGPDIRATGQALQPTTATPVSATSTPASASATATVANCLHKADFIDDVTIRDGTQVSAGQAFVKIWRLRNSGECAWTAAFLLSFFGGQRLGAPDNIPLSRAVQPGESIDLAVDMRAPSSPGSYQGYWKLRTADGEYFGIGPNGDQSFWVKIQVPPPPTAQVSATASPTITLTSTPTGPTPAASSTASATPTPTETATSTPDGG